MARERIDRSHAKTPTNGAKSSVDLPLSHSSKRLLLSGLQSQEGANNSDTVEGIQQAVKDEGVQIRAKDTHVHRSLQTYDNQKSIDGNDETIRCLTEQLAVRRAQKAQELQQSSQE